MLTIHRSKGLEFPIVYAPFVYEPTWIPNQPEPIAFHEPDAGDERMIDVGLEGQEYEDHRRRYILEERGEDLRLAYVALTRAKHQAVIWWAGTWDARNGALGRLCFSQDDDGDVSAFADAVPDDATVRRRFEELAAKAPGRVSVEVSTIAGFARWEPDDARPVAVVGRFIRPPAGLGLAADVVQRHHRRRLRGAGDERARGRGDRRRARRRGPAPVARVRRPTGPAHCALAPCRDAGRDPRRHVRAPGLRGGGLRGPRPPRRTRRGHRRRAGLAGRRRRSTSGGDRRAPRRDRDPAGSAPRRRPPARPRNRRPPGRARVRAPARRRRRPDGRGGPGRDRLGARGSISPPAIRSPATPTGSRIRPSATSSAATSPAASTSSRASPVRTARLGSPSSTTRATGWPGPART